MRVKLTVSRFRKWEKGLSIAVSVLLLAAASAGFLSVGFAGELFDVPEGRVSVIKKDQDGRALPGARLQILDAEKKPVEGSEFVSGTEAVTLSLPSGTYYLHEIKAPEGYRPAEEDVVFSVRALPDPSAEYTAKAEGDHPETAVGGVSDFAVYSGGELVGAASCVQPGAEDPPAEGFDAYRYINEADYVSFDPLRIARIKKIISLYETRDSGITDALSSGGYSPKAEYTDAAFYIVVRSAIEHVAARDAAFDPTDDMDQTGTLGNLKAAYQYVVSAAESIGSPGDLDGPLGDMRIAFFTAGGAYQDLVLLELFGKTAEAEIINTRLPEEPKPDPGKPPVTAVSVPPAGGNDDIAEVMDEYEDEEDERSVRTGKVKTGDSSGLFAYSVMLLASAAGAAAACIIRRKRTSGK